MADLMITRRGTTTTSGGDTEGLNYTVVGGTTQPGNPIENTVWISTDQAITGHAIGAREPDAPVDGMVWIQTVAFSSAALSVLQDPAVTVYPIMAKQYSAGAWVKRTMEVYLDGVWVPPFDGRFYLNGESFVPTVDQRDPSNAVITENADRLTLSTVASNVSQVFRVFGPVPLDDLRTLSMTGYFSDGVNGSHYADLFINPTRGATTSSNTAAVQHNVSSSTTKAFTVTLDVSAFTGLFYVYAGTSAGSWNLKRTFNLTELEGY